MSILAGLMPRLGRRRLVAAAAIALAAAGLGVWRALERPAVPSGTLTIGYQHNPPYQVHRPGAPPTGLSVETVAEAARRAGIRLDWRLADDPDRALAEGALDLWPLMTDLPERRRRMHITAPWLQARHALVLPRGRALPGRDFAETVAVTAIPVHLRMLKEHFPAAQALQCPEGRDALLRLCSGEAAAAFLESRLALAVLREAPTACAGVDLQAQMLPGGYRLGVGSTFAAAAAADRIRDEIGHMAKDGTLAVLMARHSFFGLDDTRATYDLLEAQARNRRLLWVIGGLSLALGLALLVAFSLRSARHATEAARRELEHAVAELERRNAELERFTYTVSHDLRSPLVTVTGFLGAVEAAALRGDTLRLQSDMARVRSATQRMDRLLRELLELSRVGRTANEPETVPFAELVREALSLVDGRLQERGVRVELAEPLPAVRGDRRRLVELVQNLIDNAAKFMGDQQHPRIEVGARAEGPQTVFFVRDNGRGIEPRYHDKVFGLFDRLDPADEGTGVGLALVKRIVEVHGGRVWVESDGPGRGSTFCFTLPLPPAPAQQAAHPVVAP